MRDPERWTCSRRKTIFVSTWRTHGRQSLSPTKSSTISTQRAARLSRPPRTLPASRSTPRIVRDNYAGQLINDRSGVFNGTHQRQFKAAMKSSQR
ncbi:hypothetical protein NOF04DRAFT_1323896 [Fusarium oxysporum II5]|nr:hypothetical protein NOF04DRAFT_1323896 [Fusarium oxysporum II5]